jgi:prepilin-type N-terminal cleavage/methylation domain-containing protein
MFKMKKNQKGFTLVEVLLVVVILGILAAVALPRFLTTRVESQFRTCQANLSAINGALEEYHFMHGEFPADNATFVSGVLQDLTRFPDGPPQCPADPDELNNDTNDYTMDGNNRCQCASGVGHILPGSTT